MKNLSCIIPVYNEGPRIANVLTAVCGQPDIMEVIVVDDASTDNTAEVVKNFKEVKYIRQLINKGKTKALLAGVKEAKGGWLLFLDADLVGLTSRAISGLIMPVKNGEAEATMSLRKNSPWLDRVIGVDIFSGERVLPKNLLLDRLEEINNLPRFGFESYLNRLIIKNKLKLKVVWWPDVLSPWKFQKAGWKRGLTGDVMMVRDILKTISVFEILYQYVKLLMLNVK